MVDLKKDVYKDMGYEDRDEYLEDLANEHGTDMETVCAIASILGPGEDFDGLVSSLEDFEYMGLLGE